MSRDYDRTIGPRTAIKRYGAVSARCSALSQPDRPSDSSASTPPPTTILTFNATWSLDRRFGSSGQKQPRNGAVQPLRHDSRQNQTTITAIAAQLDKAPRGDKLTAQSPGSNKTWVAPAQLSLGDPLETGQLEVVRLDAALGGCSRSGRWF